MSYIQSLELSLIIMTVLWFTSNFLLRNMKILPNAYAAFCICIVFFLCGIMETQTARYTTWLESMDSSIFELLLTLFQHSINLETFKYTVLVCIQNHNFTPSSHIPPRLIMRMKFVDTKSTSFAFQLSPSSAKKCVERVHNVFLKALVCPSIVPRFVKSLPKSQRSSKISVDYSITAKVHFQHICMKHKNSHATRRPSRRL